MPKVENERVVIKSEGNFYASLLLCPSNIFENTRGIIKEKKDNSIYLTLSSDILNPDSLFYRYLSFEKSRKVFGTKNPLYKASTIVYEKEIPVKINHFNTRLLLAFLEVELAIGFEKTSLQEHQDAIKDILEGKPRQLKTTNYYHPFLHEDNIGYHYVQAVDGNGGYFERDWDNFLKYSINSIKSAYAIAPEDFGSSLKELNEKTESFLNLVSSDYQQIGKINSRAIRRFGHSIYETLYYKGSENSKYVLNPASNEKMAYIPLIDCLLDMPYKKDTIVTFQSGCDDSF
ncbi:MAG: hypothetical protein ABIJ05_02765 [Patescibacteria group bacterium]